MRSAWSPVSVWRGLGAGAVIATLTCLPSSCLAQEPAPPPVSQASPAPVEPAPANPASAEPALGEVQPLTETQTTVPLPAPAPPAGSATPAAGTASPAAAAGATMPAAAMPAESHPSEKRRRKAEKLYLQGAKSIEQDDPRAAFASFSTAVTLDPANTQYVAAREIARQHLLTQLVQEAEKARLTGHPEVARQKLEEAAVLDPKNPVIAQHIDALVDDLKISVEPGDGQATEFEGPIELVPEKVKKSFHLKATQQDLLHQVLAAYQVTAVMDSSVTQQMVRLDADDVDWDQASMMVKMLTGTFFVPLDPRRVLVARDTKENRQKFERLLVESVFLPGLSEAEMTQINSLAKTVFDVPVATLQPSRGVLTVRAPERQMQALNATLAELLDGRAQVMVDVRLYDINYTRVTNVGLVLPSQMTVFNVDSEINSLLQGNQAAINQIIASGLAAPGDYGAILAILIATGQITSSLLTQGFAVFGGGISEFGVVPGTVTGNLSFSTSDSRVLDDIQIRVQDQEEATFRVGTRYPLVTSTYSSGGGSSLNIPGVSTAGLSSTLNGLGINLSSLATQTTIPQIQYQDLGLTLKAKPRVQHGQSVVLDLDLEFTALAGSTLDGNPILNNRKYTATINLPDGNSAMVVTSLSKQETKAVTGIPGLSELPGMHSTTDDSKNITTSSLLVLVTPHIIRRSHVNVAGREILLPIHN